MRRHGIPLTAEWGFLKRVVSMSNNCPLVCSLRCLVAGRRSCSGIVAEANLHDLKMPSPNQANRLHDLSITFDFPNHDCYNNGCHDNHSQRYCCHGSMLGASSVRFGCIEISSERKSEALASSSSHQLSHLCTHSLHFEDHQGGFYL